MEQLPRSFGKYVLARELGHGGMGMVFEAHDANLKRRVALKVMIPHPGADPKEAAMDEERFLREGQLLSSMPKHPHVVCVYEAGVIDGQRYMAMDFVDGQPMATWCKSGSASLREQVRLLRDVAMALHHAHTHGIIHRDLKPQNVLVDVKGEPHILDFGLARTVKRDAQSITGLGLVVGTPTHMSPEQASGSKNVDRRTDVYAMGVMLYEILTGRLPFAAEAPMDILIKAATQQVTPPSKVIGARKFPQLNAVIESVCLRALAKKPEERTPNAKAFAEGLTRWLIGQSG